MIYRPAMIVTLDVPVLGSKEQRAEQVNADNPEQVYLAVISARIERNDHNHADAASIVADWEKTPLDPRTLDDGIVTIYIGEEDEQGFYKPQQSDAIFIGIVSRVAVERDADSPTKLMIDALDYTALFLQAKPFGSKGIPEYSLHLDEAWRKICSQTPGSVFLKDSLELRGLTAWPLLATAVANRFANLGKVATHPETDAWAVWQECVGMMGLLSFIERDRCVVTTATDYYTSKDPPRLVWGNNIISFSEERNTTMTDRGVACTSHDPISGKTIEVFYDPPDKSATKLRAKKLNGAAQKTPQEDGERYDYFSIGNVTQPDVLHKIAERIYAERSRQELSGRLKTAEMRVDTLHGDSFDLMKLGAGDDIRVELATDLGSTLLGLPSHTERVKFLVRNGYPLALAQMLASNAEMVADLDPVFFVSSVVTELEMDEESVMFSVEINYVNKIQLPEKKAS